MPSRLLSDNEVHDRLTAARDILGEEPGQTAAGDTALEAARRGLRLLSIALLASQANRREP
jgi:hypothetical protein